MIDLEWPKLAIQLQNNLLNLVEHHNNYYYNLISADNGRSESRNAPPKNYNIIVAACTISETACTELATCK